MGLSSPELCRPPTVSPMCKPEPGSFPLEASEIGEAGETSDMGQDSPASSGRAPGRHFPASYSPLPASLTLPQQGLGLHPPWLCPLR